MNPVNREIEGLQEHGYQVTLAEGQFASVVVRQDGVDLLVQLLGGDGKSIVDFDADMRQEGVEKVEVVAPISGKYRLIVKRKYPKLAAGRYEIRLVEVRSATENDRLLDEARRLRAAAWRLRMADKYAQAFPLAEKALELQERVLGLEHQDLAPTLLILAIISDFKVEYAKAEAFYLRGQKVAEQIPGSEDQVLGLLLNYFAAYVASRKGDITRAELLFERALFIQEKALGPDHPEVARTLRNLGLYIGGPGNYARAVSVLQRSLTIYERAFGNEHEQVINTLNRLAVVYTPMGDFAKAEPLLHRSLDFWEKTYGPNHGWVAIGLNNLSLLYRMMGDYDRAKPLMQRAISINEANNGSNHPSVLWNRAILAMIHYHQREYAKADALYSTTVPALEKSVGPTHRSLGSHLGVWAKVYIALNDHEKAESLSRRALAIMEAAGASPAFVLLDLARISAAQGKLKEAVAFQARANPLFEYALIRNLAGGSERQKLAYLATLPEQLDQLLSVPLHYAADDPTARELGATAILQRKGRVQDALSNSVASLRERFAEEDKKLLDRLNAVTSQLARLIVSESPGGSPADHQKKIRSLEEEREKLETEVSGRSAGFYQPSKAISLATIREVVPSDAALIEFAVYRPFDPKAVSAKAFGEPRYVAYVIRNQREVRWTELGAVKEIDAAVARLRQALREPRRNDVQELARAVDEKVMRPVRFLAGDANHLLISPDGELNLIPFEAFVDEKGRNLIESYSITYLTTGRDLARMQVARNSKSQPAVVANPVFGEQSSDQLVGSVSPLKIPRTSRRRSVTNTRNLSDTYFAPLSGTGSEANSIKTLFPEVKLLTGASATETAVKELAAPKILHIATHGYFLDDGDAGGSSDAGTSAKPVGKYQIENPLLRSGLALAGANRRSGGRDDGILTALEASGLNLWGTKLVVLSACDTGLGEIRNSEGVYGLRRSFMLAGAESLVMSLWPVSDYVTRELMTNYYQNLRKGMGRGEALRQVQLNMIKRPNRRHPFYWASFIQLGEWANLDGKR